LGSGKPAREFLSAGKAGGLWVSMQHAMTWWFLVDRNERHTSWLMGGVLKDFDGRGTYTLLSKRPVDVGSDYEDISVQIEAELMEAERIAKPHEFGSPNRISLGPPDYLQKLRQIWNRKLGRETPTP
jgi:hypothetical protein